MKNRDKTIIAVVAFMTVITVVGFMTFNRYEARKEAEQAKAIQAEEKKEEITKVEKVEMTNTTEVEAKIEKEEEPEKEPEKEVEELTFSEKETIIWPVDGDVILNYSMDQTIYFPTLEQYKYNPALVISAEEGNPVLSAADGKVKEIRKDAKIGEIVVVDLGNGYEGIYGQLGEIRVSEGQRLEKGDTIGYVDKPTKYYTVEGPNVYFQMLKDGEPVNPLEFMGE